MLQVWEEVKSILEENEKMSVNELFKCVAIASANDASVLIGEGIAGSHQEFVKMMNEKAKAIETGEYTF